MDFSLDATTLDWRGRVAAFMDEHVYPAEPVFAAQLAERDNPWSRPPVLQTLKQRARDAGLWNMFLPGVHGAGLTTLQFAPLAELMGRSIQIAPETFNCSAPDSGNMEILSMFGTDEQQKRWLQPLLDGTTRSAFAMTEPDVASSDATNIRLSMQRDGDEYVLNGRKWFSSGALAPEATFLIVVARSEPEGERHRQHTMVIVPKDAPGLTVRRGMSVLGYSDDERGGHAEIDFDQVRVPLDNVLGEPGGGFAVAQARLGPGRVHHCMRALGIAERAIEIMCARAKTRHAFGRALADQGVVRHWIAESTARVEQARLLVLRTAWKIDTVGAKNAHEDIQLIKVVTPSAVEWILDKAIQLHGAAGLSQDTPLAYWFAQVRTHRIVDGPDEVHWNAIAKRRLAATEVSR